MDEVEKDVSWSPYIPADRSVREFTLQAVVLGVILAVTFGAANGYLGLAAGMTVSASIPSAVMSMAILRGILKRGTILENNIVQTIGTAGESVVAGVIFTIPALIFIGFPPSWLRIFLVSLMGGVLGVLLMIPLRRYLIVKEHKNLPYPEGTACAEVLIAGERGGEKAFLVFGGLIGGMFYEFLKSGLGLWKEKASIVFENFHKATLGINLSAALLGVGFIVGPRIASMMFAGGALSWVVIIPLIHLLGSSSSAPVPPSKIPILAMDSEAIWENYIRYIGAGAVALGGGVSMVKALPTIISSAKVGIIEISKGFRFDKSRSRTDRDLPMGIVLIGSLLCLSVLAMMPGAGLGILGIMLLLIFTYFFVAVSSRIVGLVGSSSSPTSGMTIAVLLMVTLILVAAGYTGKEGMIAALTIGAVVCIAICTSGDTSQDLKTGYYVGSTPIKQQLGFLVGTLSTALISGLVIYIFRSRLGSSELPAPQATMMKVVVEGVMGGGLPYDYVIIGMLIGGIVELLGIPSLPFAIGLYLPITTSTPIIVGGVISYLLIKGDEDRKKTKEERGTLIASGMVAGAALLNVLLAVMELIRINGRTLTSIVHIGSKIPLTSNDNWQIVSLGIFLLFSLIFSISIKGKKKNEM